jgi:hypothetical protein
VDGKDKKKFRIFNDYYRRIFYTKGRTADDLTLILQTGPQRAAKACALLL